MLMVAHPAQSMLSAAFSGIFGMSSPIYKTGCDIRYPFALEIKGLRLMGL